MSEDRAGIDFDRHSTAYRTDFEQITDDLHRRCPVAWTGQHGGYWVASGNREVFVLDSTGNRHASFGLGIHRCIGSNVARAAFKIMLTQVLDRMPDFACDPAGAVHYDTTGIINGMKHLPATFTPGARLGAGLDETIEAMQRTVDEQGLAEPVTRQGKAAHRND